MLLLRKDQKAFVKMIGKLSHADKFLWRGDLYPHGFAGKAPARNLDFIAAFSN
jgi:hypothetical protein